VSLGETRRPATVESMHSDSRDALNATDNQLVVEGTANAFSEVVRVQTIPAARWTAAGVKFGKPNNICQSGGKATRRSVFESLCYWRNVKK